MLKWGLVGFFSIMVWLVFGVFIFVLGYEVFGLGCCIVFFLVKFMGKCMLMLGYVIVIIDILLVLFIFFNIVCIGGMVFLVIKNLLLLFKLFLNDLFVCCIGGYLMWMMVISISLSLFMFVIGAVLNVLGLEFVSKIVGI